MKRFFCIVLVFILAVPAFNFYSFAKPAVSAKAAIVVNGDTGSVIYAENENKRLPMASTTKIMTALLLLENADLSKEITATNEMVRVEGSSMGLLAGDKVTYKTLLYGLMLPSGNDAANTVAISLAGSIEKFALMMNEKAAEIGMENTNFVTPSGLDSKLHYSTVSDMAKLAVYAMKNKEFRKAVSTKSIRVEYGNPPYRRVLKGHNKMLGYYDGANGIKTGYTSISGRCLVSSAKRGCKNAIAVTLCDDNTLASHKALLDYAFDSLIETEFKMPSINSKTEVISGDKREVGLAVNPVKMGLTASEREKIRFKISVPEFLYADVKRSDTVGKVSYYIDGKKIKELSIFAKDTVNRVPAKSSRALGFANIVKEFLVI